MIGHQLEVSMRQFFRGALILFIGGVVMGCVRHVVVDRSSYTTRDYKSGQLGINSIQTFPVVTDLDISSQKATTTLTSDSSKSMRELKDMVMLKFSG